MRAVRSISCGRRTESASYPPRSRPRRGRTSGPRVRGEPDEARGVAVGAEPASEAPDRVAPAPERIQRRDERGLAGAGACRRRRRSPGVQARVRLSGAARRRLESPDRRSFRRETSSAHLEALHELRRERDPEFGRVFRAERGVPGQAARDFERHLARDELDGHPLRSATREQASRDRSGSEDGAPIDAQRQLHARQRAQQLAAASVLEPVGDPRRSTGPREAGRDGTHLECVRGMGIAAVSAPVVVGVHLIRVRERDTVVAGIADAVSIGVGLVRVPGLRAAVSSVRDAVVVEVAAEPA